MRLFRFILTTYFLVVFLSSTCAKNRGKFKSKKNTWRLRLLRKLYGELNPNVKLLKLSDRHQNLYLPEDSKGRINVEDPVRKHIPVIQCEENSSDLIACPSPNSKGVFYCISEELLCDKVMNCPNGEDEDLVSCMFHKWANTFFTSLSHSLADMKARVMNLEESIGK
ncbi:uncharacterized protein LOC133185934 [Saccostrea echinata]|uniref:uncharacterized protein LOC133185934 n=1 Tax=Saccostrea echinata TaxID=191078 RepID=UPI002A81C141|nr:uncharacterized protein LOC133185934 [Saccostrea echinata]